MLSNTINFNLRKKHKIDKAIKNTQQPKEQPVEHPKTSHKLLKTIRFPKQALVKVLIDLYTKKEKKVKIF